MDSGAAVSLCPTRHIYQNLFGSVLWRRLHSSSVPLLQSIPVVGQMSVEVCCGSQGEHINYMLWREVDQVCSDVTGFRTCLDWTTCSIKTVTVYNTQETLHEVIQKYAEVFWPGLSTLWKFKAHLKLKEGALPWSVHLHPALFSLKGTVEKEIDRLEKVDGSLQQAECSV